MSPAPLGPVPYLTLAEVAEVLRLNPRTVRDLVRRRELPGRLVGNRWRFRREDVDAFFDACPSEWERGGTGCATR